VQLTGNNADRVLNFDLGRINLEKVTTDITFTITAGTKANKIIGLELATSGSADDDYDLIVQFGAQQATVSVVKGEDEDAIEAKIKAAVESFGQNVTVTANGDGTITIESNVVGETAGEFLDSFILYAADSTIGTAGDDFATSAYTQGTDAVAAGAVPGIGTDGWVATNNSDGSVTFTDSSADGTGTGASFTISSLYAEIGGTFILPQNIGDNLPFGSGLILQVGANSGVSQTIEINIASISTDVLGLTKGLETNDKKVPTDAEVEAKTQIKVDNNANSRASVDLVDHALNVVSEQRARLGALQNRLEYTISNLDTSAENLQASEARIRDTDMAGEMTKFTKNNILFQASIAMLAQANALPQGVLQLLG